VSGAGDQVSFDQNPLHGTRRPCLFSASSLQLDGSLYEVEAACAAHLFQVALLYREEAALVWTVLIDTAGGRAVSMFLEKGALEQNLAAGAATITFATPERELRDDLFFAEVDADEAAQLALCLSSAQPNVLYGA
jgi:hypothetical protein